MTSFGPDKIIACPYCRRLAKERTLESLTIWGVDLWTDGKKEVMYMPTASIVKCCYCSECYWRSDAEDLGSIDEWIQEGRPTRPAIKLWREPTAVEYYAANIEKLATTPERERYLRICIWRRTNDEFRHERRVTLWSRFITWGRNILFLKQSSNIHAKSLRDSVAFRSNLEALIALLNTEKESDLLMRAEVLRELGQFEDAVEVLKNVTSPEYENVSETIRTLCSKGDTEVRRIQVSSKPSSIIFG